ncbi:MAG TPA: adenosylcobinamide-GDP ribazoletransferase [Mycobacteriales bacterium]|jgi:adenosylcobinamide-GDP ribazoletransferase|nr:adenosylcobinamide-GDP ribazoletransferase [Mycobacteriales bacterium]
MRRAVAFLTVLGGAAPPAAGTVLWFPLVGALVGVAVGGVWVGADRVWPTAAAAAVTLAADAILTGGLHLDGLADTGDGLFPPLPRERRLAVMADPRIGAVGAIALGVVLLTRFAALAAGPAGLWVVVSLWCGSRSAVAVALLGGRYARADGLASGFRPITGSRGRVAGVAAAGLVLSLGTAVVDRPGHGMAALAAEAAVILAVTMLANRRLGGYTGDVLGAQIVLGETAGLLVWAAQW